MAQHGEAQDAGHGQHSQSSAGDEAGLSALPAGDVPQAGHDVLKHGKHGGQSGKGHEDKEQAAPQPAAGHVVEDVGQGLKYQAGARTGLHTKGGAGGEDDQARGECHEGIQANHIYSLAHKGTLFLQIAAKDGHGADAQAQGEEALVHGCHNDIAGTNFHKTVPVRQKIELQTLSRAGQ